MVDVKPDPGRPAVQLVRLRKPLSGVQTLPGINADWIRTAYEPVGEP